MSIENFHCVYGIPFLVPNIFIRFVITQIQLQTASRNLSLEFVVSFAILTQ
jgi:predicted branched-subunit amino acid permease